MLYPQVVHPHVQLSSGPSVVKGSYDGNFGTVTGYWPNPIYPEDPWSTPWICNHLRMTRLQVTGCLIIPNIPNHKQHQTTSNHHWNRSKSIKIDQNRSKSIKIASHLPVLLRHHLGLVWPLFSHLHGLKKMWLWKCKKTNAKNTVKTWDVHCESFASQHFRIFQIFPYPGRDPWGRL